MTQIGHSIRLLDIAGRGEKEIEAIPGKAFLL